MTINNGAQPNDAISNLDRASSSREVGTGGASESASTNSTNKEDWITLSNGSELIQQARTAQSPDRTARIQQIKNLIQTDQYNVDPVTVGRALVDAHLSGI
jgi:anti-sigma28 factor (negative regulator of flagellin synthesis)